MNYVLVAFILLFPAISRAQVNVQVLHSFGATNAIGQSPGQLVRGLDGTFYGCTDSGISGSNGFGGVLFKLDTSGANPQVILKLADVPGGSTARNRIVASSDGAIYAWLDSGTLLKVQPANGSFQTIVTTAQLGTLAWQQMLEASDGRLYALAGTKVVGINRNGTGFQSLYTDPLGFTVSSDASISDLLIEGPDHMLYVSHIAGGTDCRGFIYKLNKDGSGQTNILDFGTMPFDQGSTPHQLLSGSDGFLYGVAVSLNGDGSFPSVGSPIFRMDTNGANYTVLARLQNFPEPGPGGTTLREGGNASALIESQDGRLYGAVQDGGANRAGSLFRLEKNGNNFTNLMDFPDSYFKFDFGAGVNRTPGKFLFEGIDGRIHGTTRSSALFRYQHDGSAFETVFTFPDPALEGQNVTSTLSLDNDGTIYGTTRDGGSGNAGTLFKMKSDGTGFTYLRQMAGFSDGSAPNGGVVVNSNGLFGACYLGGASSVGTTFSISKVGTNFQLLHPFVTTGSDGRDPAGLLLLASNNSFYGTTYFGGGAAAGSIFQLSPNGIIPYSIIFRFTNSISGANPSAKLLEGADGLLYGSAETNGPGGQGVLFSLAKSGAGFQLLHSFSSTTNSLRKPQGALIQGSNGFLYGTTSAGGADGFGGVFKLNTNGSGYQVLHEFSASGGDCRAPVAGVTFGPDGMLYGVTQFGGGSINGSLFRLNTDGTGYQKLFAFTGLSGAGANPVGALIRAPDGTLYGTTSFGGDFNMGTIFSVSFPAPLLSINNLGPAGIQLRWPTNSTGFHLVSNTNLSNASGWQLVNATTVTTNGNFQVGLSATGSASFFRLVQP